MHKVMMGLVLALALTACGERGPVTSAGLIVTVDHRPTQEGTDIRPVAIRVIDQTRSRLVPGDEIDALETATTPQRRFADYQPKWRVECRTFAWWHLDKEHPTADGRIETKDSYEVVLDGDKVVALLRSGDIQLIARTPVTADTRLRMPTERFHLDNLLGPSLPTHSHIQAVKTHGSIYAEDGKDPPPDRWESDGIWLAYVRERRSDALNVICRYVFTVDPVYGYRIDAERSLDFAEVPVTVKQDKKRQTTETLPGFQLGAGTFTPGCYVPWDYAALYDRTVYTPSRGGISGWANNLLNMDRCDADKKSFDWRDGGFIAYLPGPDGWSPCFTRKDGGGPTRKLSVCNAHNDFHITIWSPEIPRAADGRYRFAYVHRLLSLPPEMSKSVWERIDLIQQGATGIIVKLGAVEDFEHQPVPLTEATRGLVWTSGQPELVDGAGRGGGKAIHFTGRSWPNLPQVSLIPGWTYRLQAWFKIVPWDQQRIAEEKEKDAALRAKLTKEKKELPPAIDWDHLPASATVRGDWYEWSPYADPMVVERTTPAVTAADGRWHESAYEFTVPQWGPNINISFQAEFCDVLMDDFGLVVTGVGGDAKAVAEGAEKTAEAPQ